MSIKDVINSFKNKSVRYFYYFSILCFAFSSSFLSNIEEYILSEAIIYSLATVVGGLVTVLIFELFFVRVLIKKIILPNLPQQLEEKIQNQVEKIL